MGQVPPLAPEGPWVVATELQSKGPFVAEVTLSMN